MPEPIAQRERRQQARGMLWLAAIIVLASIARAWKHHMFGVGWWRLW